MTDMSSLSLVICDAAGTYDTELAKRIAYPEPHEAAAVSLAPLTSNMGSRYSLQLFHKLGVQIGQAQMDQVIFRGASLTRHSWMDLKD